MTEFIHREILHKNSGVQAEGSFLAVCEVTGDLAEFSPKFAFDWKDVTCEKCLALQKELTE